MKKNQRWEGVLKVLYVEVLNCLKVDYFPIIHSVYILERITYYTKGVNVNLWVEAALRSELLIQHMNRSPSVWSESRIQRCFSYRVMHDKIPEGCFIHPLKYSSTKIFRNSSWMDYSEWCYVTGVDPHWSPKWELTQRADVNKRKPFCCLFRQSFTEC